MKARDAIDAVQLAALLVAGAAAAYAVVRVVRGAQAAGAAVAETVAEAGRVVVELPARTVDAAVEGVQQLGETIGIPRTSETECQRATREGRWWDASFACSADEFIGASQRRIFGG